MKKLYLASLLMVGLSISAFAADNVPVSTLGGYTFPNYAGSKTCTISASTGTAAVLCATGSGIVLQVIPTTTTTQAIVFRDSATANTSSAVLGVVPSGVVAGTYIYPRFYNGLSANVSTTTGTSEVWTVIYAQPK